MMNLFGTIVDGFDRVFIDSRPEYHRAWSLMLKGANVNGEILVEQANEIGAIGMSKFHGKDTLLVARQPLNLAHRMQKRMLDIAVTVPLVIVLFVPMVLVAIAIKLDSPGPVFFRQQRVGRGNRLFEVLKFRSMKTDRCDSNGDRSTARGDDRITRVGQFIRATSIDELPQLLNVLVGDMSLVGPRPHALGSLAGELLFWQVDETYWLRHQLKPGITGLAQIRGLRGNTVATTDLTDRLQADMEYIQGWSIWRDLAILANTARVVLHPNAY
jgi:lipopolysaccharide/colanic/teichoic acid biosynthesis glycosyltransferase